MTVFCLSLCTASQAQSSDLLGTWDIIEFSMITEENTNISDEKQLTENGSVWSLFFMDEGKFKQSSNMRTGTNESHAGTWRVSGENLILELQLNERKINLNYLYKLNEDVLELTRSNPMGTVKIMSKFRRQ